MTDGREKMMDGKRTRNIGAEIMKRARTKRMTNGKAKMMDGNRTRKMGRKGRKGRTGEEKEEEGEGRERGIKGGWKRRGEGIAAHRGGSFLRSEGGQIRVRQHLSDRTY